MTNSKTITLPNGDSLTVYQRRNKWLQLKWWWKLRAKGNNQIIGNSQPSGFHNFDDCIYNFQRVGLSAVGFTIHDI